MTVDAHTGGAVVPFTDDDWSAGLEDIDASDVSIPRIKIMHKDAKFKDMQSGMEFGQLDTVILGVVKQRIMWNKDVEDKDGPQCKSPDFIHGFPNLGKGREETHFPWDESNFDPSMALPIVELPTQAHPDGFNSNGHPTLGCGSCVFKEWGKNAKGKSVPPPCSEVFVLSLLYTPDGGQTWIPGLLQMQKSSIGPAKKYISTFAQQKKPLFSVVTSLTLTLNSRGSVEYSVPNFARGGETDMGNWGDYAAQARSVRGFLRQAPRGQEEEGEVVENAGATDAWAGEATATVAAPPAAPAAPAAPTPPAPAAPAPPKPPAPAAPAAARPAPAPATPAAPSAPATATPAAPVQDADDDDDIPF